MADGGGKADSESRQQQQRLILLPHLQCVQRQGLLQRCGWTFFPHSVNQHRYILLTLDVVGNSAADSY